MRDFPKLTHVVHSASGEIDPQHWRKARPRRVQLGPQNQAQSWTPERNGKPASRAGITKRGWRELSEAECQGAVLAAGAVPALCAVADADAPHFCILTLGV